MRRQYGLNGLERVKVIYRRQAVFEAYDEIYNLALMKSRGELEQIGLQVQENM